MRGARLVALGVALDGLAAGTSWLATWATVRSRDFGFDSFAGWRLLSLVSLGIWLAGSVVTVIGAGVLHRHFGRPRRLFTVALVGLVLALAAPLWSVALELLPQLASALAEGGRLLEAWSVSRFIRPVVGVALAVAVVLRLRTAGRPLGALGLLLLGLGTAWPVALALAAPAILGDMTTVPLMLIGPELLVPLPLAWACLRLGRLPGVQPEAASAGITADPRLAEAIESYRAAAVARIWMLVAFAGLTVTAGLAQAPSLMGSIAVLGGLADFAVGFLLASGAWRIAAATSDEGKGFAVVAVVANGLAILVGAWAFVLTLRLVGVDEISSYSSINSAMAAQEQLPVVATLGQIAGMTSTLPLIAAIRAGLVRAGALGVAARAGRVAGVLGIGGLLAIAIGPMARKSRLDVGVLLLLAGLALAMAIAVIVMYVEFLRKARDALRPGTAGQ
jgi:hypothetical protein